MFDPFMRRLNDPLFDRIAAALPASAKADHIPIGGFVIGLASPLCAAYGAFLPALAFLAINRIGDGLDGALARRNGATDRGAYLDIVADFLIWSLLPIGFAIAAPQNAIPAVILMSSFAMSMTVFLAFSIFAEKHALSDDAHGGVKGIFYISGLAEGTETIAFFAFVLLWPEHFAPAAYLFAGLVYLSVAGRIIEAFRRLSR